MESEYQMEEARMNVAGEYGRMLELEIVKLLEALCNDKV